MLIIVFINNYITMFNNHNINSNNSNNNHNNHIKHNNNKSNNKNNPLHIYIHTEHLVSI